VHSHRRSDPTPYVTCGAALAVACAIVASGSASAYFAATPRLGGISLRSAAQVASRLAEDAEDENDTKVPPDQVEKYVAVYKDMQRDRGLTIDKAAAKEGLTVSNFRDLEQKIERDEPAREHVRTELQAAVPK
jgi:hypothetical protein